MFINISINKGAIQRGQQDKGLKHRKCTGPGHVAGPTWLQEAVDRFTKLNLDGWKEEWWFHKSRVGLAVEDVVGGSK